MYAWVKTPLFYLQPMFSAFYYNMLLIVFLVAVVQSNDSTFAELAIRGPPELLNELNETQVWGRPALFGMPEYNGEFDGILLYPSTNQDGCKPFRADTFRIKDGSDLDVMAVLDRGDCHFVLKVYNAQVAGAKGVVIVNNVYTSFLPFMADDGLGGTVNIPSIIINMAEGQLITKYLEADKEVEAEIVWGLTTRAGVASLEFFTSVFPENTEMTFVEEFQRALKVLGHFVEFRPRFKTQTFSYPDADECTNGGRYCFSNQKIDGVTVEGHAIVRETLTQSCVFNVSLALDLPQLWWEYRSKFDAKCSGDPNCYDQTLSKEILNELNGKHIGLQSLVDKCISDSGSLLSSVNSLLEEDKNKFSVYEVTWTPRLVVNGDFYHGSYLCPQPIDVGTCSILSAICSSYMKNTEPTICKENGQSRPHDQPHNETHETKEKRVGGAMIFLIVALVCFALAFCIFAIFGFLWIKQRFATTDENLSHLQSIYRPLDESSELRQPSIL